MRWLVAILLLANLAYAGSYLWMQSTGNTAASIAVPEKNQRIKAPMALTVVDAGKHQPSRALSSDKQKTGLCASLEFWPKKDDALVAKQALGSLGSAARVEKVWVDMPGLDWVYLPAAESIDQARKVLKQLRAKNIDSFITVDGDRENAISLGSFEDHALALKLQKLVRKAGFNAKLRETQHKVARYRLDLGQISVVALAKALKQWPNIKSRWQACDDIS